MRAAALIATGLGVGYSPLAPGSLGALWGLALAAVTLGAPWGVKLGVLAAVSAVGIWASERVGRAWGHDHRQIVIDETAGQYLTLLTAPDLSWFLWGFVVFRLADIAKPYPVNLLDEQKGGFYTMADDLAAGVYGVLAMWLLMKVR